MEKKQGFKKYTNEEKIAYYTAMFNKAADGLDRLGVDPNDVMKEWNDEYDSYQGMADALEAETFRKMNAIVEMYKKKKKGA